jgi:hypothetical protein
MRKQLVKPYAIFTKSKKWRYFSDYNFALTEKIINGGTMWKHNGTYWTRLENGENK